ncbi:MAG: tRNA dihydrouridine synthase DusB, partial [Clostridia bacterium]|nr:tRNA dihydrouridine synthase DusB [Clostridia bacterium]
EIKDFLLTGGTGSPPTKEDRVGLALRLLHELCEEKGEGVGVRESRARVGHLIRGIRGSAAARWAVNRAVTEEEFEKILTDLLDQTGKGREE